jgi:hypothetical protein
MKESPLGWPTFQPAVFVVPDRFPAAAREAFDAFELPRNLFGRYRAASELVVVKGPSDRRIVRFGEFEPDGTICFEPSGGQVVSLVVGTRRTVRLVNSSLDTFSACVRGAFDLFPYYRANADKREKAAAGIGLEARVMDIDPAAIEADGFWRTLIRDVSTGGLSTEEVVSSFGDGLLTVEDDLYVAFRQSYEVAYKRLPSDPHRLCPNCGNDALRIAFETRVGTAKANVVFWCAYCLIGLDHVNATAPAGARAFKYGSPEKGVVAAFPELRSVRFLRLRVGSTVGQGRSSDTRSTNRRG